MRIFMPVRKDKEVLDGVFDFCSCMVYSSLAVALEAIKPLDDQVIMEGELLDEKEIAECVCQSLIGNRYSKLKVKWVASYTKKMLAA